MPTGGEDYWRRGLLAGQRVPGYPSLECAPWLELLFTERPKKAGRCGLASNSGMRRCAPLDSVRVLLVTRKDGLDHVVLGFYCFRRSLRRQDHEIHALPASGNEQMALAQGR